MLSPEHGVGAPIRAKYEPDPDPDSSTFWVRDDEGYGLTFPTDMSRVGGEVPERYR